MSLEAKFVDFKNKHDLSDDAIAEILIIFNESFIELAHKLLNNTTPSSVQSISKKTVINGPRKWATKIAAEYASENDVTLDNFDKEKITKKDIDEFLKARQKTAPLNTTPRKTVTTNKCEEVSETQSISKKGKCKGLTKTGEPCNRPGAETPDGAKNCYCFRHALDWKNYEVSSDSELEEEDIFTDPNKITDLAIRDPEEE
jgi:hypothetical protein